MVYKDVSFNTTAMALGTVPEHKRMKVSSIIISDPLAGAKTLYFHDVITTNASNGAAATTVTKTWLQVYLPGGTMLNYGEPDLKGIELLGAVDVSSNVASSTSNIAVNFSLE